MEVKVKRECLSQLIKLGFYKRDEYYIIISKHGDITTQYNNINLREYNKILFELAQANFLELR